MLSTGMTRHDANGFMLSGGHASILEKTAALTAHSIRIFF